jgi:hypothetical protein
VGVAADHLLGDGTGDVGKGKGAALFGQPGVQHHLEQHIAQLAFQLGFIPAGFDCLSHFVRLLEEVLNE